MAGWLGEGNVEKLKEMLASILLLVTAGWLLAHLVLIQIYGVVTITESNRWILWAEICLAGLILVLGIERLIKDIRR